MNQSKTMQYGIKETFERIKFTWNKLNCLCPQGFLNEIKISNRNFSFVQYD